MEIHPLLICTLWGHSSKYQGNILQCLILATLDWTSCLTVTFVKFRLYNYVEFLHIICTSLSLERLCPAVFSAGSASTMCTHWQIQTWLWLYLRKSQKAAYWADCCPVYMSAGLSRVLYILLQRMTYDRNMEPECATAVNRPQTCPQELFHVLWSKVLFHHSHAFGLQLFIILCCSWQFQRCCLWAVQIATSFVYSLKLEIKVPKVPLSISKNMNIKVPRGWWYSSLWISL